MTQSETGAPRANRNGDPCPSWCTTDHGEMLIDGEPQFGYMNGHHSDAMTGSNMAAQVVVRRSGLAGELPEVSVRHHGMPVLDLNPDKAAWLAKLLESLPTRYDLEQLAGELRAAAAIAGEQR